MAQSSKNVQRRQTRAARRAQEEALAQAQALQAAKERRQQTIIGVVIVAALLVAALVAGILIYGQVHKKAKQDAQTLQDLRSAADSISVKPQRPDKDYGIYISRLGYGKLEPNVPTISIYMDPICPGCASLNRELDPMLISMMQAGQINLDLHPIAFMDRFSTDDYSSRAASGAFAIAEKDDDPLHLLKFFQNIYSVEFQPHEGRAYKPVSDEQLIEQAIKAGVSEDIAKKSFSKEYQPWVLAQSKYTVRRPDLVGQSGQLKGQFSTPTIAVNNHTVDLNEVYNLRLSLHDTVLQLIGLDRADIGVSGKNPKLNGTDAPNKLHALES